MAVMQVVKYSNSSYNPSIGVSVDDDLELNQSPTPPLLAIRPGRVC